MTLRSTARAYLRDAVTAFDRAPTEVGLSVLAAALLSYALEIRAFPAWVQVGVALFITFAFAWTGTLLHALRAISWRHRWLLTVFGAVCAVLYLLLVDNLELEAEGWRALLLAAGSALLMLAAPGWVNAGSEGSLRLRRINARFLLRTIGIALYGLALFGGLALALAAIEQLFELKLDAEIYGHVFGWIMLVLVPWVVVGGLDDYVQPLDLVSDVARVAFRLVSFLVPPLVVLYFAILFVYAVRILVTGEMPKNLVSPMVLAAGLLTALAAILFDPAPADARNGARILRAAPALFLLLVPLGLWALFVRIDDYGWTEFRLLRVLLLILLFGLAVFATVQLVRRHAFTIRAIPLILGAGFILSAIGPWSVLAIARRDQQDRLADALSEAQIDPAQPLSSDTTHREVPRELYDRINDIAFYLQHHFGADALPVAGAPATDRGMWSLADHFRLMPAADDTLPGFVYGSLPPNAAVRLAAGATVYRVTSGNPRVQLRGTQLTLLFGAELHVSLDTLLAGRAPGRNRREQQPLPAIALPAIGVDGSQRGELIIFEAAVQRQRDSVRVDRLDGILIVR
ncbi:MAG TPA: DUF4153 domain-containing protein [Longimicrobiales bacterium]